MTQSAHRGPEYGYAPSGAGEDDRRDAPAFHRNSPPIVAALAPMLGGRTGAVLEIGAGTGQHAAALALAFPMLDWWPSDPMPDHRASITAWARSRGVPERGPLDIDASADWAALPDVAALGPLTAVFAANVIHIAPWSAALGLVRGAGQTLARNGLLILYGPFAEAGHHTGAGNRAFDADLRARNPDWGLRDTHEVIAAGAAQGLTFDRLLAMPANNRLLVLRKAHAEAPT